ncbi:hypothetical protein [Amycolatopsis sp.]|uniref:hypothetical protein n=1 Tax=Amycolatopsis sp. TaxID=37632 RepID=UPI002D80B183|nr:hypothetical protein [Amycolatopsis sp.]HET6704187.1 hypothetical protein [Amycolatopsis sp.]
MNNVESTVNTTAAPAPLALGHPEQPVAAICDQFFAHGGAVAVRAVPAVLGGRAPLSVGDLLGFVQDS